MRKLQYPRIYNFEDVRRYLCQLIDALNAPPEESVLKESYFGRDFDTLIGFSKSYGGELEPLSAGVKNAPVNKIGVLNVISYNQSYVYQTYITIDAEFYARTYSVKNGWTSWKKI